MKKKLLTSVTVFLALALTACNLGPKSEPAEESKQEEAPSSEPISKTVSKHVHTYNEDVWEKNETQHWHPATCEHTDSKGSAAAHDFQEVPNAGTPATCSQPGSKIMKCTVCGYEKTVVVKADHDFQAATTTHEQATGEVTETIQKCSRDDTYKISWDAQDAAKTASSGFDSAGKFKAKGDYASYTFYSPKALSARLYLKIANRSSSSDSPYDRSSKSGNQSIWFDYYNGPDWKYEIKVNDVVIDQNEQGAITVGDEEVAMKELMYQDFLESGADTLVAPWIELSVIEGLNTIRIERTQGYSVSVKEFYVIGA